MSVLQLCRRHKAIATDDDDVFNESKSDEGTSETRRNLKATAIVALSRTLNRRCIAANNAKYIIADNDSARDGNCSNGNIESEGQIMVKQLDICVLTHSSTGQRDTIDDDVCDALLRNRKMARDDNITIIGFVPPGLPLYDAEIAALKLKARLTRRQPLRWRSKCVASKRTTCTKSRRTSTTAKPMLKCSITKGAQCCSTASKTSRANTSIVRPTVIVAMDCGAISSLCNAAMNSAKEQRKEDALEGIRQFIALQRVAERYVIERTSRASSPRCASRGYG